MAEGENVRYPANYFEKPSTTMKVAQRFAPHDPGVDQADESPRSPRVTGVVWSETLRNFHGVTRFLEVIGRVTNDFSFSRANSLLILSPG